ncbi:Spo12 [Penicillium odoratum]|uniref:Spo12 n=1 Tax=Penicillium odoratum TaxID=1167516 RepID=UPI0025484E81|nr:Spo12 [Penicillium odoratum]KAJ5752028.1 Spo12 [Penicillium odoratum]
MDATTQMQPLADRSTNTHLANANVDKTDMKSADLSSMEYHRQMLQGKQDSGEKQPAAYVSPSDDIMSPCTKKLSDIKGKRFKKYVFIRSRSHQVQSIDGSIDFKKNHEFVANILRSAGKPQSLFAKLGKKNYEQSASAEQGRNTE